MTSEVLYGRRSEFSLRRRRSASGVGGLAAFQRGHPRHGVGCPARWPFCRPSHPTRLDSTRRPSAPDYLVERKLKRRGHEAGGVRHREIEHSWGRCANYKVQRSLAASPKAIIPRHPHRASARRRVRIVIRSPSCTTGGIGRVWMARDGQMGRDGAEGTSAGADG